MNTFNAYNYSVLLVEDEPIVQHVHTMMLKRLGCRPEVASNAKQALAKMSNEYQLIFMDIGLPDLSGIEVIKKIRCSESKSKSVPIVVLTAYSSQEIKEQCFNVGANAVFTKPISQDKLKNILDDFINNSL